MVSKGWAPLKGPLADYVNASKGSYLLGEIQAFMLKDHARPSTRKQNVIHPSEMSEENWCPLATYLRILACRKANDPFVKEPEKFAVQILNIFDEGHFIHDKWQRRLWKMGKLWGNSECLRCGQKTYESIVPFECFSCLAPMDSMVYREVPLCLDEYLISGHADGAVLDKNCLIEIKSIGEGTIRYSAPEIHKKYTNGDYTNLKEMFKAIEEPFPSHIKQGQIYLHLCNKLDLPFTSIDFIYESKFTQGVKEFHVQYDPAVGSKLFSAVKVIVDALDNNGPLPVCPTGICKECVSYGAKNFITGNVTSERTRAERFRSSAKTLRRTTSSPGGIVRFSGQRTNGSL